MKYLDVSPFSATFKIIKDNIMYTAVLIDDEINASKMLEMELNSAFPSIRVLEKFQNPIKAISFITEHKPDLLFIDIEMPQLNGIDFVKQVDTSFSKVIFLTAYRQYAVEAVKSHAIDYLLKPLDSEELKTTVERAIKLINEKPEVDLEEILKKLKGNVGQLKIPTTNGFAFLKLDDIIYCQSDSNYTHIFTTEKEYLVSKTLKSIQESLPESDFLRIHNSYLVNTSHIVEYTRKDGGYVILSNGVNLRVSNSKKDLFRV